MAYNLADRFPELPKYYPLLDPGTYETITKAKIKSNVVPFLSKSPRVTQLPLKIWTDVIYSSDHPHKIPNCSAMMLTSPRFPYEVLMKKLSTELICECDTPQKCECASEENKKEEKHEATRQPRILVGPPPRRNLSQGLSAPCTKNKGIFENRYKQKVQKTYCKRNVHVRNANIRKLIAFYGGSKHSKRSVKTLPEYPGPATYNLTKEPTQTYICAEKVRAFKRKTSKQYRFIELIQRKNLRENLPGPANYNPQYPKGTELQFYGPKAKRFSLSKYADYPGPNNYNIKRDFDLPISLESQCHATLPVPRSAFGGQAPRFKYLKSEGPGPASYNIDHKSCMLTHCPMAPFGATSSRFRDELEVEEEYFDEDHCMQLKNMECEKSKENWMFKSQTIRMASLKKNNHESSPADMPPKKFEVKRSQQLQSLAPFGSSVKRFQPWYNWIPVHDTEGRPGPGTYDVEQVLCVPAVVQGPLFRCKRFKSIISQVPPPNAYNVKGGLETILHTHNKKLDENINKKHKFQWKGFTSKTQLSDKEKESHLVNRCLTLLNTDLFTAKKSSTEKEHFNPKIKQVKKTKMLKCFLYNNVIPNYF